MQSGRNCTKPGTVLWGKQPSAGSLTGRPPDIVLQSMQPSLESFAVRLDKTRHRSSRNAAFGGILNWTTSRHRSSREAALRRILKRTTPRHWKSFPQAGAQRFRGERVVCIKIKGIPIRIASSRTHSLRSARTINQK